MTSAETGCTIRIATMQDRGAVTALIQLSMDALLQKVLSPEQVKKSQSSMGLDTQLIKDGTYFVVFEGPLMVGCGGWSRRRTLFGGDDTNDRDEALANPQSEPAKIRALYTHPNFIRRGIASRLLRHGESAARAEGFKTIELGATASGISLYEKSGYRIIKDISEIFADGTVVPNILMRKTL